MFSILIPSYNNLEYLKICIESIKKNSVFKHQIIIHINEGNDGTINYVKNSKLDFTYRQLRFFFIQKNPPQGRATYNSNENYFLS